ncbi:MAG: endo-1,4-beta-xylanase [Clostridiales bacterium]|nr:endo-1,4-beta-xylanase [Clostridiales bacterium]
MKKSLPMMLAICLVLTLASASAAELADYPSLKDFYADYFDFGSSMSTPEVLDIEYLPFYAAQYAIVTPENVLKPEYVLDEYNSSKLAKEDQGSVALQFRSVKPLLEFAQANGLKVNGHVLFWHEQTPDTFFRESYAANKPYVSREVMLRRMENYVRISMAYMEENYPGIIVSWDVINEAIDDSTGGYRESKYTQIVGEDWVLQAFRFARKYAPEGMLLVYNEYSVPYQPKLTGILSLLDELIAEDLVDVCGMQCHYQLTTPTISLFRNAVQKIVDKGLKIRVSELDILIDDDTEESFNLQAKRYADIMKVLLQYSDYVIAVQTWGTFDTKSWKSYRYPLLFAGDKTAKPAFYALIDAGILP